MPETTALLQIDNAIQHKFNHLRVITYCTSNEHSASHHPMIDNTLCLKTDVVAVYARIANDFLMNQVKRNRQIESTANTRNTISRTRPKRPTPFKLLENDFLQKQHIWLSEASVHNMLTLSHTRFLSASFTYHPFDLVRPGAALQIIKICVDHTVSDRTSALYYKCFPNTFGIVANIVTDRRIPNSSGFLGYTHCAVGNMIGDFVDCRMSYVRCHWSHRQIDVPEVEHWKVLVSVRVVKLDTSLHTFLCKPLSASECSPLPLSLLSAVSGSSCSKFCCCLLLCVLMANETVFHTGYEALEYLFSLKESRHLDKLPDNEGIDDNNLEEVEPTDVCGQPFKTANADASRGFYSRKLLAQIILRTSRHVDKDERLEISSNRSYLTAFYRNIYIILFVTTNIKEQVLQHVTSPLKLDYGDECVTLQDSPHKLQKMCIIMSSRFWYFQAYRPASVVRAGAGRQRLVESRRKHVEIPMLSWNRGRQGVVIYQIRTQEENRRSSYNLDFNPMNLSDIEKKTREKNQKSLACSKPGTEVLNEECTSALQVFTSRDSGRAVGGVGAGAKEAGDAGNNVLGTTPEEVDDTAVCVKLSLSADLPTDYNILVCKPYDLANHVQALRHHMLESVCWSQSAGVSLHESVCWSQFCVEQMEEMEQFEQMEQMSDNGKRFRVFMDVASINRVRQKVTAGVLNFIISELYESRFRVVA
ncbi:hypothetical protein PR048_009134 [Dryococelus australis]|uniref:Uncharacterized protein n=1 Tax=Dryococelus australis TaxID=614101 RepID=A0ABQ9HZ19_9NEOP|nr:hypothetical protein PR048_009134 [Dryococelus australis]